MLTKRSYFLLLCDHIESGRRCDASLTVYIPPECEQGASIFVRREAGYDGWQCIGRGHRNSYRTLCRDHNEPKG
jgi:nitrogen fixation protein